MPQNKPLTFEEFIKREPISDFNKPPHPNYNNFSLHFDMGGVGGLIYRETPHSKRFQREHPDLDALLREEMANLDKSKNRGEALKPFEPDLYKAYVIMYYYIHIPSDADPNKVLFA